MSARYAWFPPATLFVPVLWLFRKAVFSGETFVFRDAAHFYYPLYQYVQARWQSGLPLWNPLEGLGQPLLGDPTAAVLYPAKLIFFLPLSYQLCFALYVISHLWFAGYGTYKCARCLHANWAGALLAGLAYELSGHVLFQYANPIYLVGAAWLPWSLICIERMLVRRSVRDCLLLAVVMSMTVLGGDPQMAYHIVIIACVRILLWKFSATIGADLAKHFGLLMLACSVALALAAVQILPSYEWAARSDRSIRDAPRSVWEWSGQLCRRRAFPTLSGMWSRGEDTGTHGDQIYEFSVEPWRWSELFFPGVSGRVFPVHGRWIRTFPGAARSWTPSLYLGLLPIVLALYRWRIRRGALRIRWLSCLAAIGVLAALGDYGLGWCVNEVTYQLDKTNYEPAAVQPGFGGLYWLLTVLLPNYVNFRYPSKWWTVASLALSLLAAKGWPLMRTAHRKQIVQRFFAIALGWLACVAFGWVLSAMHGPVPVSPIFGPFDRMIAGQDVATAIGHTIATGVLLVLASRVKNRHWASGLVLLTMVELILVQQPLIATLNADRWTIARQDVPPGRTLFRAPPELAYPDHWRAESSVTRFADLQRCDVSTLMPKHHLQLGRRSLRSTAAMSNFDYWALWRADKSAGPFGDNRVSQDLLSLLGAETIIAPKNHYSLAYQAFPADVPTDFVTFENREAYPRAWLVQNWSQIPEERLRRREALLQRTRDVLYEQHRLKDFRDVAVVESRTPVPTPSPPGGPIREVCEVQRSLPERVQIAVNVDRPSLLVLRDQYYPGWQARLEHSDGRREIRPIVRVNRVFRGVFVDAGPCIVEFQYRPASVWYGVRISGIAWTCCLAAWMYLLLPKRSSGSPLRHVDHVQTR